MAETFCLETNMNLLGFFLLQFVIPLHLFFFFFPSPLALSCIVMKPQCESLTTATHLSLFVLSFLMSIN